MTTAIIYHSQAVIQAGVTYFESSNPWLFAQIKKIEDLVLAINFGAVFLGGWELIDALDPWIGFYKGMNFETIYSPFYSFGTAIILTACSVLALAVSYFIHERLKPQDPLMHHLTEQQRTDGIRAEWGFVSYKIFKQAFHALQMVISVALVFFSVAPHFYALSAACQLYSFIKTSNWMWINVARTIQTPRGLQETGIVSTSVSYAYAALPAPHTAVCSELPNAEHPADTYWHGDHYHCNTGAIQHFAREINTIHQALVQPNAIVSRRKSEGIPRVELDQMEHSVTLPAHLRPSCPICPPSREEALENKPAIFVRYRFESRRNPGTWIEKAAKATLTFIQPEAAPAVVG